MFPKSTRVRFLGPLLVLLCGLSFAQDVHILLRAKDGKTWFHLGEPITMEAACRAKGSEAYLMPCDVMLRVTPPSADSKVSADPIDYLLLDDAMRGDLPPKPRGMCGTILTGPPSKQSVKLVWQQVVVEKPFPTSAGHFVVTATLAYDVEMKTLVPETAQSDSDQVEISTDDDLGWKERQIHFRNCDYNESLTLIPHEDAIKALRAHLDDCAVDDTHSFEGILPQIVWLQVQVHHPEMYLRIQELEKYESPETGEGVEAQRIQVDEKPKTAEELEGERISRWFYDRYRQLLLETAQQLVRAYKAHPELRKNEEFQDSIESGFENWRDVMADLGGHHISRSEKERFLKEAGRSPEYIRTFIVEDEAEHPPIHR